MENEFLIIDTTYFYPFRIATILGNDVFASLPHEKIVRLSLTENWCNHFKLDTRRKIVIVSSWNVPTVDISWAELVIACSSELFVDDISAYDKLCYNVKNKNVVIITTGVDKRDTLHPISKDLMLVDPYYWFKKINSGNSYFEYDTSSDRPYKFDALLGTKKEHRNQVYNHLAHLNLINCSLVNLHDHHLDTNSYMNLSVNSYSSPGLFDLEDPRVKEFKTTAPTIADIYSANAVVGTIDSLTGETVSMSCMVPELIYKNSWFSIVCETTYDNEIDFITEKTAKAIFAKRVFILVGSKHSLARLHALGFKTFDGIIDESYDNVDKLNDRIAMAMQQVLMLAESDPVEIYRKAKEILDYNSMVMDSLTTIASARIKEFLAPHLNQLCQNSPNLQIPNKPSPMGLPMQAEC